jgi:hypothetical protein
MHAVSVEINCLNGGVDKAGIKEIINEEFVHPRPFYGK